MANIYNRFIVIIRAEYDTDEWIESFSTIEQVRKYFIDRNITNLYGYNVFDCDERMFVDESKILT